MPLLYVAGFVMSVATAFFDVSHQSYVPGLVGLERIVEGNSKLQATQSVAAVVAPAVGGALLRVIIAPALLTVTAVTYTHLRAHETRHDLVCRLLLEKKKKK